MTKIYTVATDGLCKNNQASGGQKGTWAFVVFDSMGTLIGGKSGANPSTTNNAMEATAVLEALKWANKFNFKIDILCDSKYVVDSLTKWLANWAKNGWKSSTGATIANKELFQELHKEWAYSTHKITWVRGHAGNHMNEAADSRCNEEYINAFC
jgi:ribonuclease HI